METTEGVELKALWNKPSTLDEPIDKVLEELRQHDPESPEFATNLTNLERLMSLKKDNKRRVSPDTIWWVGGNFALGGLVLLVENRHIFNTKVLGLMFKTKPIGR